MGLIKKVEENDPSTVRLWVAPVTGIILCADERFADNFGVTHAEVAGRAFSTLGPDIEALDRWAARVRMAFELAVQGSHHHR